MVIQGSIFSFFSRVSSMCSNTGIMIARSSGVSLPSAMMFKFIFLSICFTNRHVLDGHQEHFP